MSLARRYTTGFARNSLPLPAKRSRQTIVVPVCDIRSAEFVLRAAAGLASGTGADVRLIYVRPPDLTGDEDLVMVDDGRSLTFSMKASDRLDAIARQWSLQIGVPISVSTRVSADVASVLERELIRRPGFVLVQQSPAMNWTWPWQRNWQRDVLEGPYPVLAVPTRTKEGRLSTDGYRRPLISVSDDQALGVQAVLAIASGSAEYSLIRVLPLRLLESMRPQRDALGPLSRAAVARNEAWRRLHLSQQRLEGVGAMANTAVVFDGAAAGKAILDQAATRQADLIVIGRQHPLLSWFRHSDWRFVAAHSEVPVLLHSV